LASKNSTIVWRLIKSVAFICIVSLLLPAGVLPANKKATKRKTSISQSAKKADQPIISLKNTKPDTAQQLAFASKAETKNSSVKQNDRASWPDKTQQSNNNSYSLISYELPAWLSELSKPTPSQNKVSKNKQKDFRSPQHVSQILNSHNEEIQDCYYQHLKRNPELAGKFVVRIFINSQGTVVNTEIVESTIKDKDFQKQILSKILSWDDFGACKNDQLMVYRQEYIFGE